MICVSNIGGMDIERDWLFQLELNKSLKDFWDLTMRRETLHSEIAPTSPHFSPALRSPSIMRSLSAGFL
jgi:hypothetical protein